jgi:hypothetical protein
MDLRDLEWRSSSVGSGDDPEASRIEVAMLPDGGVAIRDSKNLSLRPHVYTAAEWDAFVKGVHNGEFDGP